MGSDRVQRPLPGKREVSGSSGPCRENEKCQGPAVPAGKTSSNGASPPSMCRSVERRHSSSSESFRPTGVVLFRVIRKGKEDLRLQHLERFALNRNRIVLLVEELIYIFFRSDFPVGGFLKS